MRTRVTGVVAFAGDLWWRPNGPVVDPADPARNSCGSPGCACWPWRT
jgi:hypothetical protein